MLEGQDQGASLVSFWWVLPLNCQWLATFSLCATWPFLGECAQRESREISGVSLIRSLVLSHQGSTLMPLFNLNYFLRGPISQYSHTGGSGFNKWIWRGHKQEVLNLSHSPLFLQSTYNMLQILLLSMDCRKSSGISIIQPHLESQELKEYFRSSTLSLSPNNHSWERNKPRYPIKPVWV